MLVTCHSEKEQAAPTNKGGSGFHSLLCFLANTAPQPDPTRPIPLVLPELRWALSGGT